MAVTSSPEYATQPAPLTPAPQPPKKRPTGLIIAGVAAGVVVLLAAAIAITAAVMSGGSKPSAASNPAATSTPNGWCGPNGCFTAQPAAPATTEPSEVTKPLGETFGVTSSSNSGKSESRWTASADKQYSVSPNGYTRPEKGVFYAIRVDVSVTSGEEYVFADDFAFIAQDGTTFQASASTYGFPNAIEGTRLNGGQKVGGLVVFDVPKSAIAGGRIELRPDGSGLSSQQAFWTLP